MGETRRSGDSELQPDGALIRLAARMGLAVFVGALAAGLYTGVEPTEAFFRALAALLVVAVCGWLGEHVLRALGAGGSRETRSDRT